MPVSTFSVSYNDDVALFVEHLKGGQSSAWESLDELIKNRAMKSYYMSIIKDHEERRDVYCQALADFWDNLWGKKSYDVNQKHGFQSLQAYVLRIVSNKAADYWRKTYRQGKISKADFDQIMRKAYEEDDEEIPLKSLDSDTSWPEEMYEALEDCRRALPPHLGKIIEDREIAGRSYEEISRTTGTAPGTLRQRLSIALMQLRACMKRKNFD